MTIGVFLRQHQVESPWWYRYNVSILGSAEMYGLPARQINKT